MTTTPDLDLAQLRELAEAAEAAATQGYAWWDEQELEDLGFDQEAERDFIEAFSPAVVLSLLERLAVNEDVAAKSIADLAEVKKELREVAAEQRGACACRFDDGVRISECGEHQPIRVERDALRLALKAAEKDRERLEDAVHYALGFARTQEWPDHIRRYEEALDARTKEGS